MTTPHPANISGRPTLGQFIRRYLSGHHLDGKKRTNATWFKRGTAPIHHVNWWSAKPRFYRMLWRWTTIIGPIGWFILYRISPSYYLNITVIVTIAWLPYIIHHGLSWAVSQIPRHTVVYVHDKISPDDIDSELDNIAIPEQFEIDDVQASLDDAIGVMNDNEAARKNRRRS